jgi:L-lactate dehydrogenase complex protein LldF
MAVSEFRVRVQDALADAKVRANIRRAMDGLMEKRLAVLPDAGEREGLRDTCAALKGRALARLPTLLRTLETNCRRNGIRVHWAETPEEANRLIHGLLEARGARSLVKGKSMVSEEIGLNQYLENRGIEVLESDLGEFILQLAGEPPSHIIAPAIHKNRHDVATLFRRRFPDIPYTEDIDQLAQNAREIMRRKFYAADAGLSGVNFAVAETGTLCLVENEGNGRMSTTVPPVHIAIMGIEKVVEKLEHIPPLLSLLTRSATGQPITTYFNMISGPRKAEEKDGPADVHLVLLDNGRSRMYADPELKATLRCIRCGACMNHCPVYARLGGHAYGTVYPGPIGIIFEPQKEGLDRLGELTQASTLCGACGEVCPVQIPIPGLINRLRHDAVRKDQVATRGAGTGRRPQEAIIWKLWARIYASPARYRLFSKAAARFRGLLPERFGGWTNVRNMPRPAEKSLHALAREEGIDEQ